MTRRGKIARLPQAVREELNQRLSDGAPGHALTTWLNALPGVREILAQEFGARPITEQNLSEWRQGGYEDWRHHALLRDSLGTLLEELGDLERANGGDPIADRCAHLQTLALARLLTAALAEPPSLEREERILRLVRGLNGVGRADHARARLDIETARHQAAQRVAADARAKKLTDDLKMWIWQAEFQGEQVREKLAEEVAAGHKSPEEAAAVQAVFTGCEESFRKRLIEIEAAQMSRVTLEVLWGDTPPDDEDEEDYGDDACGSAGLNPDQATTTDRPKDASAPPPQPPTTAQDSRVFEPPMDSAEDGKSDLIQVNPTKTKSRQPISPMRPIGPMSPMETSSPSLDERKSGQPTGP